VPRHLCQQSVELDPNTKDHILDAEHQQDVIAHVGGAGMSVQEGEYALLHLQDNL
jgi:hypothetical protein